jgi:hypothetical protein
MIEVAECSAALPRTTSRRTARRPQLDKEALLSLASLIASQPDSKGRVTMTFCKRPSAMRGRSSWCNFNFWT